MKYVAIVNRGANVSRVELANALNVGGMITVDGDTRDAVRIEVLPDPQYRLFHCGISFISGLVIGAAILQIAMLLR